MSSLIHWLDAHPLYWPIFIFLARVTDVSIGTTRTIMVVRGHRVVAAMLGLVEVTIWVVCVSGVLRNELSAVRIVAWAGGFAAGNAMGIWIDEKLALGYQLVRLISTKLHLDLADRLRTSGFKVTSVPAQGRDGEVDLCFAVVRRGRTPDLLQAARQIDPNIFLTVEDLRHTSSSHDASHLLTTGWRAVLKKK